MCYSTGMESAKKTLRYNVIGNDYHMTDFSRLIIIYTYTKAIQFTIEYCKKINKNTFVNIVFIAHSMQVEASFDTIGQPVLFTDIA